MMSLVKNVISDGGLQRMMTQGDILGQGEVIPAALTANAVTVTGAMLANSFISRAPTAAATDTIDSAANIVNALSQGLNMAGINQGTSFRTRYINNSAFAITLATTANTGVTLSAGVVNANSVKDFLVTVVNGTPPLNANFTATTGSAVLTGMTESATRNLSAGMTITNAVGGLQGAKILSVQLGTGVTLDTNATATGVLNGAFSPTITVQGIGQGLI